MYQEMKSHLACKQSNICQTRNFMCWVRISDWDENWVLRVCCLAYMSETAWTPRTKSTVGAKKARSGFEEMTPLCRPWIINHSWSNSIGMGEQYAPCLQYPWVPYRSSTIVWSKLSRIKWLFFSLTARVYPEWAYLGLLIIPAVACTNITCHFGNIQHATINRPHLKTGLESCLWQYLRYR